MGVVYLGRHAKPHETIVIATRSAHIARAEQCGNGGCSVHPHGSSSGHRRPLRSGVQIPLTPPQSLDAFAVGLPVTFNTVSWVIQQVPVQLQSYRPRMRQ